MQEEGNAQLPEGTAALRGKIWTYLIMTGVFILTSVLSFLFIKNFFGEGDVIASFAFLTIPVVLGVSALLLVYYAFDSLRFYFVLRTLGIRVPFFSIVKLSFVNIFVSSITPLATGGGFAQIYFLVKKDVPLGKATAASTIRTMLAVIFFLFAAPAAILMNRTFWDTLSDGITTLILVAVIVYCVVVTSLFWLVLNERHSKGGLYRFFSFLERSRLISRKRKLKICRLMFREIRNFNAGLKLYVRGSKLYLLLSILFTLLFLFALFNFPLILTWAIGYSVPPASIYQAQILITFITYFAVTPGASGIAEGGFAMLFSGMILAEHIFPLTLVWRFFTVYVGTVIGMVVFYLEAFRLPKKR